MDGNERKVKVSELRKKDIGGACVILRPASAQYAKDIMNLRNKAKNMYMFNQSYKITFEGQMKWFESYEQTSDDIYWCVLDKNENFIGTIRLYSIDEDGEFCEEGSYVIDEDVTNEAPYAVEAKMLALDIAFDTLQMKAMINDVRADNKVMNNMDNQLGFDKGCIKQIRGADYLHRVLTTDDYHKNRYKFSKLVEYWSKR